MNERRSGERRKMMRGYGPDRRTKMDELYLGLDRRRGQRRRRDRRQLVRRSEDLPYESPSLT